MPFRSEKQRRYLWANEPKIAREWTDEYGSKPVKAKVGKYQEFKHPQHDILPLEHMEEKVSSKERVERLLDERKKKKESKKKLAKDGPHYVPGWKPNLSVKAAEGELVRQKTRGTGAAVTGIQHYTMKGMPTAYQGQLVQVPTRGTGAAVSGDQHYVMQGMDAAKTGKLIKAKESKWITKKSDDENKKWITKKKDPMEDTAHMRRKHKFWITKKQAGGPIKAKKGVFSGAASDMSHKPKGWDVKKISDKTHKKLTKLWKHREAGGWSPAAGKQYNKYLKSLKKITPTKLGHQLKGITPGNMMATMDKGSASKKVLKSINKTVGSFPAVKSKSFYFKDTPKPSQLKSSTRLGLTLKKAAIKLGKRTGIGKAVAAATVVAGAYEAGKRKLFAKKDKKKIDKKSIGGETVVMKSGGGYIDDLI